MDGMTDKVQGVAAREVEDFRDIERLIAEHPAWQEHAECDALRRSIVDVFIPNLQELLRSLEQASSDVGLAFQLIQNVRDPIVRDRFYATLSRQMHNYLASAFSLVEHTRRIMRGRTGEIVSEFSRRKAEVLAHPEIPFIQDLRNYTLHRKLPFFAHSLRLTNVNTLEQKMNSEVELGTRALLTWDGWSANSRMFLADAGDAVKLRPVVRRHGELFSTLNIWLYNELSKANESGLVEVNQLVVRRNAALAGVDFATAERLTRGGLGSLAPQSRLPSQTHDQPTN